MTQTPVTIPAEAPVMVLPGAVLFPNGVLPLRIFEPRYRAMLEFALEHDRMFCIGLMKPGITEAVTEDQFFHTAGIGLISASVTQADGTSNLMLHGLARVRFLGFPQLAPFRIARIKPLSPANGDSDEASALAQDVRRQCSILRVNGSPLPDSFQEMLKGMTDSDSLADAVAHALIGDAFERQGVLEEQDAPFACARSSDCFANNSRPVSS
jgi:Lon protease-like protein